MKQAILIILLRTKLLMLCLTAKRPVSSARNAVPANGLWSLVISVSIIVCLFAGCKNQTPSVDPFFGRTTVPPPSTGSVSTRAPDPYYQPTQPPQSSIPQPNYVPNNYPGINPTGSIPNANAPSYAGSSLTTPPNMLQRPGLNNPSTTQQYSNQQYSNAGPSTLNRPSYSNNSGGSFASPSQQAPRTNPGLYQPPATNNYQAPPLQPTSSPSTMPRANAPNGYQNQPPNGSYDYRSPTTGIQTPSPTSTSRNHIATPYFAGGVPNRRTLPEVDATSSPNYNSNGNIAGTIPNQYSYQNGQSLPPTYNSVNTASSTNSSAAVQSPIMGTLQPGSTNSTYPGGNNTFMPASRRYSSPVPAQNSPQPTWRESSSTDTRLIDDNIEPASNTETKSSE